MTPAKPFEVMAWAAATTAGSASKKLLLLTLASYADEHWQCWPGQATLAEVTELGERTVRRLLAEMEADGLIRREERRRADGYRTSDLFTLRPPPANMAADPDTSPATGDSLTGHSVHTSPATMAGQELPVEELPEEPPEPPVVPQGQLALVKPRPPAVPRGTGSLVGFDAFWEVFPLKAGKQAARRAWAKATKRAAPADIIAGAMRYRDDPNRDPGYTKMAQGWLNDGRWEDAPLPDRRREPQGGAGVSMDALRQYTSRIPNEPELGTGSPWLDAIGGGR